HTGDRPSIMENLPHIGPQPTHPLEPGPHHQAHRVEMRGKPFLNPGIARHGVIEAENVVQRSAIPLLPRRSNPATRNFASAFSSMFKPRPGYCGTTASPCSNAKGCSPCKMGR